MNHTSHMAHPMVITGIVSLILGGIACLIGIILLINEANQQKSWYSYTLTFVGLAVIIIGLVLYLIGRHRYSHQMIKHTMMVNHGDHAHLSTHVDEIHHHDGREVLRPHYDTVVPSHDHIREHNGHIDIDHHSDRVVSSHMHAVKPTTQLVKHNVVRPAHDTVRRVHHPSTVSSRTEMVQPAPVAVKRNVVTPAHDHIREHNGHVDINHHPGRVVSSRTEMVQPAPVAVKRNVVTPAHDHIVTKHHPATVSTHTDVIRRPEYVTVTPGKVTHTEVSPQHLDASIYNHSSYSSPHHYVDLDMARNQHSSPEFSSPTPYETVSPTPKNRSRSIGSMPGH